MSSGKNLRNIIKRRTYRERSQPEARKKLGMLEKHKDYVVRAKDYHRKKDTLTKLQQKAAMRNPDEFYFGMTKTKTKGGVHEINKSNYKLPKEVAIIKDQQLKYLSMNNTAETKKLDRMRAHLHFLTEREVGEEDDEDDDVDKGDAYGDDDGDEDGAFPFGDGDMDDEDMDDMDGDDDGALMAMLKAQTASSATKPTTSSTSTSKTSTSSQPPSKKQKTSHPSKPVIDDSPIPLSLSASLTSTSSASTTSKKKSIPTAPSSSHVIFVDTPEAAHTFSASKYFDTPKELLGRTYNRPTKEQLAKAPIATVPKRIRDKLDAHRALQYQEMVARMQRKRKIEGMVDKLQMQKNLTAKGVRRKITTLDKFGEVDESKTIYKWKTERKR